MIEKLTQDLPYKLSEQINIEFNKRFSDIKYLTSGKYDYYTPLRNNIETIRILLAMSIFYKRVISNFDSANKFTNRVLFKGEAISVQLGTYELTTKEVFKLNKVVIEFRKCMDDYSIPLGLFEYLETKEFLRKVKSYRDYLISTQEYNG